MRLLLLVPIVHAEPDLGSLSGQFRQEYLQKHGLAKWEQHQQAIQGVWSAIDQLVRQVIEATTLPYPSVRLYQDGLADGGHVAEIVQAVAAQGSRNHRLLLELMHKGARLMGTESPDLLVREYDLHRTTPPSETGAAATDAARGDSSTLLAERDRYIAQKIDSTLGEGEIGLLFLGLAHSIEPLLPRDIQVKNLLPSLGAFAPRQAENDHG